MNDHLVDQFIENGQFKLVLRLCKINSDSSSFFLKAVFIQGCF